MISRLFLIFILFVSLHAVWGEEEVVRFADSVWMKKTAVELDQDLMGGELVPAHEVLTIAALLAKTIKFRKHGPEGFSEADIALLSNHAKIGQHAEASRDLLVFYREENDDASENRAHDILMLSNINKAYIVMIDQIAKEREMAGVEPQALDVIEGKDIDAIFSRMSEMKTLLETSDFHRFFMEYFHTDIRKTNINDINLFVKEMEKRSEEWIDSFNEVESGYVGYVIEGPFYKRYLLFPLSGGKGLMLMNEPGKFMLEWGDPDRKLNKGKGFSAMTI